VREIVGKSLANKMELLQGAECVLKDGVVRTNAQGIQKLRQRIRFLRGDA
jgi:ribosomal protein L7/L12